MGGGGLAWMSKEVSRGVPQRDTILSFFFASLFVFWLPQCVQLFFFHALSPWSFCCAMGLKSVEPACCVPKSMRPWYKANLSSFKIISLKETFGAAMKKWLTQLRSGISTYYENSNFLLGMAIVFPTVGTLLPSSYDFFSVFIIAMKWWAHSYFWYHYW